MSSFSFVGVYLVVGGLRPNQTLIVLVVFIVS